MLLSVAMLEARPLLETPKLELDAPRRPLVHADGDKIIQSHESASAVDGVVYSHLDPGTEYVAYPNGTGVLGYDDYDSINNDTINLVEMQFIGGVTNAGGIIAFEFYDTDGTYVDEAVFQFDTSGNYVWGLALGEALVVPDQGYLQLRADPGTYGQWFLSDALPTVGSEDPSDGGAAGGYSHNFELTNSLDGQPSADIDLAPAYYTDWTDTIVVSTVEGTTYDADRIRVGDTLYADVLVGNFGTDAAGAFTNTLLLDGVAVGTYDVSSLESWYGMEFSDINLGQVPAGEHTLTFIVDSTDAIAEYDEANNTYSRQFFVATDYNGQISGTKWNDMNRDGVRDEGEPALAGWTIYADLDDNGALDTLIEPYALTDASGAYSLTLEAGAYNLREIPQEGWTQTAPGTTGRSNNDFEVTVKFIDTSLTPTQQAVFSAAANRWAEVIVGDLADFYIAGYFIDDVMIDASGVAIDGVSGILGMAGPTILRGADYLPIRGQMQFDTADLADMEQDGSLNDVILHEMGHVLGLGSIWEFKDLLTGAGSPDPRFTGPAATAEYNQVFGTNLSSVPVENEGGSGTRDSHWRESVFDNELMTGYINGAVRPLSRVTAASMEDIGYVVNMSEADPFTAPGAPAVRAPSALKGSFLKPAVSTVVSSAAPVAALDIGALALSPAAYEVHVSPQEVVVDIDFGSYQENAAPTDISLAPANIAERLPIGAVVGAFVTNDPDAGETFTYELVGGTGSDDNAMFGIEGNQLVTKADFNFEAKSSYIIRVRSTDHGDMSVEKAFTISINDVNEAPIDIGLSSDRVVENAAAGTTVGTLFASDQDAGNTFSYQLIAGSGGTDNALFQVVGNTLKTKTLFNYEVKNSYTIRVRVTDNNDLTFEKPFTIGVTNVAEVPAPWTITGTAEADTLALVNMGNEYRLILNGVTSYVIADLVSSITIDMLGGNDSVTIGGATPVTINGGDGNDTLRGGNGSDSISGGLGDDSIIGMDGDDTVNGDAGNDAVYSGFGADNIHLGDGNDVARSGRDNDSVWAGAGLDTLVGDNNDDLLYGEDDSDTINGGDGNDTIYGNGGMDRLVGVGGNDSMYGGADRDQLMGGFDNDALFGEAGDDTLKGGTGNDTLDGSSGSDTMLGEAGDDWIYSAADNAKDVVRGDAGSDHIRRDIFDQVLDTIEDNLLV